jgi:hypothetical protein
MKKEDGIMPAAVKLRATTRDEPQRDRARRRTSLVRFVNPPIERPESTVLRRVDLTRSKLLSGTVGPGAFSPLSLCPDIADRGLGRLNWAVPNVKNALIDRPLSAHLSRPRTRSATTALRRLRSLPRLPRAGRLSLLADIVFQSSEARQSHEAVRKLSESRDPLGCWVLSIRNRIRNPSRTVGRIGLQAEDA